MCKLNGIEQKEALEYSKATLAIEGLEQNNETLIFTNRYLSNESNSCQVIEEIKKYILSKKMFSK